MEEVLEVLSSLVSDRVRHFELVKITNKSFQGKAYVLVADKGTSELPSFLALPRCIPSTRMDTRVDSNAILKLTY